MPKRSWLAQAVELHSRLAEQDIWLFVGLEGEFYLPQSMPSTVVDSAIAEMNAKLALPLVAEDGLHQFEYHIAPSNDLHALTAAYDQAVSIIQQASGSKTLFASKPYADQPSSGLHIHIHAENASGGRLFFKQGDALSPHLAHAIGGLLDGMAEAAAHLVRIDADTYSKRFAGYEDHVASTISWGMNNRSAAIRLPDSPADQKRIEYRLASSDAPIDMLLCLVMQGIADGIEQQITPPPPVYGLAHDPQYGLPKLCLTNTFQKPLNH